MQIVAEAGINHNGSLDTAFKLCDAAKECGADMVKFQHYHTASMKRTEMQSMLKKYEFTGDQFHVLWWHCQQIGIEYIASVFDLQSLEETESETIKIGSGEITNIELLAAVRKTGKPVILSTGMSTMQEIKIAQTGFHDCTLLHCTSSYPTALEDCNMGAMNTLKVFGWTVGFSDHTTGTDSAIMAVALGATVIEKHFTLDETQDGPDHFMSNNPVEFKNYCDSIKEAKIMMGTGDKSVLPCEIETKKIARGRW